MSTENVMSKELGQAATKHSDVYLSGGCEVPAPCSAPNPSPEPSQPAGALALYADLLTVDDVADVLKVSTRTIYRFVEANELPYVRVGHRLYFPKRRLAQKLCLEVA